LLERNPRPTREEVIEAISGNLCRCTGYEPIIEAILSVAHGGAVGMGHRMNDMANGFEFRKEYFADERDENLNEIGKAHPPAGYRRPCDGSLAVLR
jgi:hypothetical protein